MQSCAGETPLAGEDASLTTPRPHLVTCYVCRHNQEVIVKIDLKRNPVVGTSEEEKRKLISWSKKIVKMSLAGREAFIPHKCQELALQNIKWLRVIFFVS